MERLRPRPQPKPEIYNLSSVFLSRDTQKPDDYNDEVREYARQHRDDTSCSHREAVESSVALLDLAIDNQTDVNFPRTQVTLRLPGDVRAYFGTGRIDDELDDIEVPLPWGERTLAYFVAAVRQASSLLEQIHPDGRKIDTDGSELVVTLPPVDVRPVTKHELEPVYLVIPDSYAEGSLEIAWGATSTGAAGDSSGTLTANVGHAVVADELVAACRSLVSLQSAPKPRNQAVWGSAVEVNRALPARNRERRVVSSPSRCDVTSVA
jgi:hypothetical protein